MVRTQPKKQSGKGPDGGERRRKDDGNDDDIPVQAAAEKERCVRSFLRGGWKDRPDEKEEREKTTQIDDRWANTS